MYDVARRAMMAIASSGGKYAYNRTIRYLHRIRAGALSLAAASG